MVLGMRSLIKENYCILMIQSDLNSAVEKNSNRKYAT
jgi:hypothetical protein